MAAVGTVGTLLFLVIDLRKRRLERSVIRKHKSRPGFVVIDMSGNTGELRNMGGTAVDVQSDSQQIAMTMQPQVHRLESIYVQVHPLPIAEAPNHDAAFCTLTFRDVHGKRYSQKVSCLDGDLDIDPPTEA